MEGDHDDELTNNPDRIEFKMSKYVAGNAMGIVEIMSLLRRKNVYRMKWSKQGTCIEQAWSNYKR